MTRTGRRLAGLLPFGSPSSAQHTSPRLTSPLIVGREEGASGRGGRPAGVVVSGCHECRVDLTRERCVREFVELLAGGPGEELGPADAKLGGPAADLVEGLVRAGEEG